MCTGRWHARWHSQGQSGQLHAGSLRGRVSHSHPHKGTVHTTSPAPTVSQRGCQTRRQGLASVRLVLCVTRKVEQRRLGEVWFSLSAGILLSSSQMLSLTRKGPKCALLPLLERWDVAAAVWVTWRLPRRRRKSTRSDQPGQGMQAARGKGSILAEVGPCLLLPGEVPSAGQHRERLSWEGDLPCPQSLEELQQEMLLAELNMG